MLFLLQLDFLKLTKKIIKAPKKGKIPKAYYYDFDFVCLRKSYLQWFEKLPGRNKIN